MADSTWGKYSDNFFTYDMLRRGQDVMKQANDILEDNSITDEEKLKRLLDLEFLRMAL